MTSSYVRATRPNKLRSIRRISYPSSGDQDGHMCTRPLRCPTLASCGAFHSPLAASHAHFHHLLQRPYSPRSQQTRGCTRIPDGTCCTGFGVTANVAGGSTQFYCRFLALCCCGRQPQWPRIPSTLSAPLSSLCSLPAKMGILMGRAGEIP